MIILVFATYIWVMDDPFFILVNYDNKEYSFELKLLKVGNVHKFYVIINEIEVIYEPDAEHIYRAILSGANKEAFKNTDIQIIKLVGAKIQSILQS